MPSADKHRVIGTVISETDQTAISGSTKAIASADPRILMTMVMPTYLTPSKLLKQDLGRKRDRHGNMEGKGIMGILASQILVNHQTQGIFAKNVLLLNYNIEAKAPAAIATKLAKRLQEHEYLGRLSIFYLGNGYSYMQELPSALR